MKINFKTIIFILSLLLNSIIIILIIFSFSKKKSFIYCFPVDDNYQTAATIISFPKENSAVFDPFEISLKIGQTAKLQYSVISKRNQANFLINAIYDPSIISVSHSAFGIEIKALSKGSTLMQAVTIDGVKNIALITVEK